MRYREIPPKPLYLHSGACLEYFRRVFNLKDCAAASVFCVEIPEDMLTIRLATAKDVDAFYDLILGIARYHKQEQYIYTSKAELLSAGFSNNPKFEVLLAEYEGEIAGYISYTYNYSIWLGDAYVNIDDVFVKDAYRSKGIGEAMMKAIKKLAIEKGIPKIRWEVQSDNEKAIRFYKRLGAALKTKGIFSWKVNE